MTQQYQTIYEDNNYLIINKPAGLLVHGAEHINEPALSDQLLEKYPELAKIGEDPSRPGIMHRLDKQVSGLMAIAKTQEAFDHLKKQFKKRTVDKKYIALVYGRIARDEGVIDFPIERSGRSGRMAALPKTVKGELELRGRRAVTEFEVKQRFINYTLLKIKIKTGRTHQIRVHMSAYGHPVVGDDLYGTKKTREKNKKLNLGRIFLAASELSFDDLAEKRRHFKAGLPEELNMFLQKLK
ncbi:RluA family pseudouridine synthase [Patescibacteria group bacterium]|nr:RluA family pseudouridine synthase [Patescibacteria group bacterium]MBU4455012.1 RluA family pseudouridine synthase [Patescibacteria group bacterium]MCG2690970.1 RluA family pseudouridine synthase [Candidatus Parcubacteria bacterium]